MSSFLSNLKSAPMPPIKNVLNVAMQAGRQIIPNKNKNQQQYDDPTSEYGGSSQGAPSVASQSSQKHISNQHVSFADSIDG